MAGHRRNGTAERPDRETITGHVFALLDAMSLQLGGLIEAGHGRSFDEWSAWVEADLPFTVEEARRLRAVFLAYKMFEPEIVEGLPKPWTALWTVPAHRIGRGMPRHATQAKRVNAPELLATRLLASDPNDVSSDVASALARWLSGYDKG